MLKNTLFTKRFYHKPCCNMLSGLLSHKVWKSYTMCVKKTCSYFSKLCKSFLIYHSRSLFAQYVWMTIFLFLLALGKCITLMGSKTNVVCCSVPYITLIIGKWSLVHKKQKTLPFENSIHVERNWYHMHAIIMIHRKVLIIIIHEKFCGV